MATSKKKSKKKASKRKQTSKKKASKKKASKKKASKKKASKKKASKKKASKKKASKKKASKKKASKKKASKKKASKKKASKKKASKKKASKKKASKKKASKKKASKKKASKKKASKKKASKKKASKKKASKKKASKKKKAPAKKKKAPAKKKKAPAKKKKAPAKKKKASAKKAAPAPAKAPALNKLKDPNNYIIVIFDSCRYDSFMEAAPKTMMKFGEVERRWSYASWTAPSHYNLLTGLMPHTSPDNVYASEYYKKDFLRFNERLGVEDVSFRSLIPHLYFPKFLQGLGFSTHARVSMPVLNPRTTINTGFDSFRLMKSHCDMRAILPTMRFSDAKPSFHLLNVGETHYPYATPDEPPEDWPRISGVHGVFKHLDDHVVGGQLVAQKDAPKFFDQEKLDRLRDRQVNSIKYLDKVVEELFDMVPKNTYITITADHGELFGEGGYFGHGPINHDKVFEVPFLEGKVR